MDVLPCGARTGLGLGGNSTASGLGLDGGDSTAPPEQTVRAPQQMVVQPAPPQHPDCLAQSQIPYFVLCYPALPCLIHQ